MSTLNLIAEPGTQAITMTRAFDAPRDRVYRAFTDPKAIPQWWGPRALTTTVEKMDVKLGGVWRYIQHDAGGNEFAFHGVYHAAVAPERLVYTFEFEGMPGHVMLETITFEERDGKTYLTDISVFQSTEDRDGMIASGMEGGAEESMDRLGEYLRTMI
jgi:uncharacterized protein YndB with AHSA1/START domain